MSKFSMLLGRVEEQAIRIHELEREQKSEREAARHGLTDARLKNTELRQEISRLSQPRDPDGKMARAYEELHRVILDAHSLLDRTDLPDADKVKSIHGLLDQVLGNDWFANSPHKRASAFPATPKRTPRKPATMVSAIDVRDDAGIAAIDAANAAAEESESRDATADDAPEYVTPDGKFDAEAEDEDAREFARDH